MDFNTITCTTKGCKGTAKHAGLCETCTVAGVLPEGFVRVSAKPAAETLAGDSPSYKEWLEVRNEVGKMEMQTSITQKEEQSSLADLYPKYHKHIPKGWTTIDVYAVCQLFPVDDPSGCINHARKKLLVPGVRTGGKSMYKDVMEARDTLNRWLELNTPSTDSI